MRVWLCAAMFVVAAACDDTTLSAPPITCKDDPTMAHCPPVEDCTPGLVKGRVCAPDQNTVIAGADVIATGTCGGQPFEAHVTADADGLFEISVPNGARRLIAVSGSFKRTYDVTVAASATTELPGTALCFERDAARIAVVDAYGDDIAGLLDGLGLQYDLYTGNRDDFWAAGGGRDFLTDKDKLAQYDVVMIDCAAAYNNGKIDLGPDAGTIAANLRAFVEAGGSLFASDWAFLFVQMSFADDVSWRTFSGEVTMPFKTNELMGYGPQSVTAVVTDGELNRRLNKDTVPINFPWEDGARSRNWGLIDTVSNDVDVLLAADAQLCETRTCSAGGATVRAVPLAVLLDKTQGPGGAVVYTAFHNIAQDTTDVGEILKYLIFKL